MPNTRHRSTKRSLLQFTLIMLLACASLAGYAQDEEDPATPEPNLELRPLMTQQEMELIVAELASESSGGEGLVQFIYNEVAMLLISDAQHNRMRIVAPIIEANQLTQEHLYASLISNYHLALNARYALGDGVLYSTYIHPLKELTRGQIESALRQVSTLAQTFGTDYTSGELSYGTQQSQGQDI